MPDERQGAAAVPLNRLFDELAALAAIRGDSADLARWRAGSTLVESRQLRSDADLARFLDAPPAGIDPELHRQLRYVVDSGNSAALDAAIEDLPSDLRWLFESGAVSIGQLASLHLALGVTSAADLLAEVRRQAVRNVPGLDAAVEAAVAAALPNLRTASARIPLGRAISLVEPLLAHLRGLPTVEWALPVGSLRRGQDMVGDIELVAPAGNPSAVFDEMAGLPGVARLRHRSPRRLYVQFEREQVGIRCPAPASAGGTLLMLTGSPAHVEQLRAIAAQRGWALEPEGLIQGTGPHLVASTEEDIYTALDLPFIPPEIREGHDELAAARRGELPSLIVPSDIRGDLHMHSRWSDGRDPIEAMVQSAVALGYEYVAITDHSQRSAASRSLSIEDIPRQADEIAILRERYPQITILHGCEVDIMSDGRLDFADRILQGFDIVLASLHERAGQSPDRLLGRYLEVMRHPLVSIVTHPTNRLVPHRHGYEIDYDRLFSAAAETGTVLEIDGAPAHLDLDGALARRAILAGVLVSIDSDAHRADLLGRQMQLGLLTARRGWVESRHVLNTRSIQDVRTVIRAKRSRQRTDV